MKKDYCKDAHFQLWYWKIQMTLLSLQKNLHSLYVASKEHNKGIFFRLKPGSIPACFYKNFIFAKTVKEITQIILTIENPDIIPSLKKVLGQINGVTISKTKKAVDTEKKIILKSVEKGYKEVKKAENERSHLPLLDDLIAELQETNVPKQKKSIQ